MEGFIVSKQKMQLANKYLVTIYNSVFGIKVPNSKTNTAKFKLLKLIENKTNEYQEDNQRVLAEFAVKDDAGEAKKNDDGSFVMPELGTEERRQANTAVTELADELVTIEYGEYSNRIKEIMDYLANYEGELDGNAGQGLFLLLDAYEESKEEK